VADSIWSAQVGSDLSDNLRRVKQKRMTVPPVLQGAH